MSKLPQVLKMYHNNRHIKLFNFPGECDLAWVRPVFEKFGVVKKVYRDYMREYKMIENGTVTVVMEREALVSRTVWIQGNRFRTWYAGQGEE